MSETPTRDPSQDHAMSVAAIWSERTESEGNLWTRRLVLFLRIMAVISVLKGLYHWAQVTGFIGGEEEAFENQPLVWQTATVYFAVIELVAAVGLWLATPWGAVVWLTTVVSMAVIELMFSLTFSACHTCYAGVSNFNGTVPICDSATRRSVNSWVRASMKGCEKPLSCRLNRRFTLLNS